MSKVMNFEDIGIIQGDEKRHLEDYLDAIFFDQRKDYDEYYINVKEVEFVDVTLQDLMYLSERFKVVILNDVIHLQEQ